MADVAPHQRPVRPRIQFSLRLLLTLTAVIAVLVAGAMSFYRHLAATKRAMHFRQAVEAGDLKTVDEILNTDPRLAHGRQHTIAHSPHTALQMALGGGSRTYNPKVVDRILLEKPDVNETSSSGLTALHFAAGLNNLLEVQRLLQLGADLNAVDDRGNNPLHLAIHADPTGRLLKVFLDNGADPNIVPPANPPEEWAPPLHTAARNGLRAIVVQLLDAGAAVDARDAQGRTALHLAVAEDHRRLNGVSGLLLKHGADLTARDDQGRIPGEHSDGSNSQAALGIWREQLIQTKDTANLHRLLNKTPQVLGFHDWHGQTLLHHVCSGGMSADLAKHLIDAGAKLNARDQLGQTPLHLAARHHNHDVLRLLLAKGADFTKLDKAGTTVLNAAFLQDFQHPQGQETIELIRQAGHAPTVLYAAATGDLDLLRKLTDGELEALDRAYPSTGSWPIYAAVLGEQTSVVQWLLARGVDPDPPRPVNWAHGREDSPFMIAVNRNLVDIAILLAQKGANLNYGGSRIFYPLHHVISRDRDAQILEALLAHGAEYESETAVERAKDPKLKNGPRYLELLNAAANKSAAER